MVNAFGSGDKSSLNLIDSQVSHEKIGCMKWKIGICDIDKMSLGHAIRDWPCMTIISVCHGI